LKFHTYIILFFLLSSSLLASSIYTEEEQEWIKNNPIVNFGADYKWPPFDFADSNGEHTGLSSDYLKLISKKTGLKFNIQTGSWAKVLNDMQEKKFDGLSCAVETEERKKYLNFSLPYLSVPMVVMAKKDDNSINSIQDLSTKVVSVNKNSYIHEWMRNKHPNTKLHLSNSNEKSLELLSLGKVDAYIGNLSVATYIMNKYLINNLKIVEKFKNYQTSLSIAIDKDKKILFSIINKTIKNITQQEHQIIKDKWKNSLGKIDDAEEKINFTAKQKEWIKNHKTIKYVIDNHWKPIEFFSLEKGHSGVTRSYIELIAKKTGLNLKLIPTKVWSSSVEKINSREADLYTCVAQIKSRKKYVNFSTSYLKLPQVIITKLDIDYVENIKGLYGKTVALVKGYYITELIKSQHKEIKVLEVQNGSEAFKAVTKGDAYAYIEMLPVASHFIQKKGYSNLKISGVSGYDAEFSMALRNDWDKTGIEIINMALNSITEKEKNNIYNKWINVKYNQEIDYTLLWQALIIFLIFISASLYWNRKLSIEIKKRIFTQNELIEANKKLEKAKYMAQSANKAKSDFLSNMSHEIRTPMNAILGFAELLDDNIEDKRLKSFVKPIRSSGETLMILINDILDLSKIESGKLEIVKSQTNIKNLLEEIHNIFQLQAEKKGINLSLELDDTLPASLLLDEVRVKEVMINLIGNALKFTDKGYIKTIVNVENVYDHISKIDLSIKVEDTGIGIDKSQQESIFNIFEQSNNQDIKKYGGTGLGLAISKRLVTLMDGTLKVRSDVGKGSIFIANLKNIDIASLTDNTTNKEDRDYTHLHFETSTILVVDDIKENRDLIVASFIDTKIEILEAKDGQEAVDIAKSTHLNLIFMDIRMPVMDGYRATRLIKEFVDIPIIALTASIMQDDLDKIKDARFDGYLRKPVSKNELFKEIAQFIKYDNSTIVNKKSSNIIIDNSEELQLFLHQADSMVDTLYQDALHNNDLDLITLFCKELHNLATKYNIDYLVTYSQNLLDKVELFEIDSIITMLKEYESIINTLKKRVN